MIVSDFAALVRRMVDDESVAIETIIDGIRAAQSAISSKVPKRAIVSLSTDGASSDYVLDATSVPGYDVLAVEAVSDGTSFYERFGLGSGASITGNQAWWLYPSNTLHFVAAPSAGTLTLYCVVSRTVPQLDTDEIDLPDYLIPAASYYVAAYTQVPEAVGISSTNPWKTRVDSGDPEDNPLFDTVYNLMRLYEKEMSRIHTGSMVS